RDSAPGESSVFLQVVPTLASFQVPPGEAIRPGVVATLVGSGFVEGTTQVDFPGAGRIRADDVLNDGFTLKVRIPTGITSGLVKVVATPAGTSIGQQIDVPPST